MRCPRRGEFGDVGRDPAHPDHCSAVIDQWEFCRPIGVHRPVRVDQHFTEDLPLPSRHDLAVVAPVFVSDRRVEEVVIGPTDQTALDLGGPLQCGVRRHKSAVSVFGVDQHIGVLQHAFEHLLLPSVRGIGLRPGLRLDGEQPRLTLQFHVAHHLVGQDLQMPAL